MGEYCDCRHGNRDRAVFRSGLAYCSDCAKLVRCDARPPGFAVKLHPAEITDGGHFLCWRHWDPIADLTVRRAAQTVSTSR